ncbi:MAG: hypothetical protein ACRD35_06585 [Candidatus Acidiferrales bacterium]
MSVALNECPFCPPLAGAEAGEPAAMPLAAAPKQQETAARAMAAAGSAATAERPRAWRASEEESPYWRGAKMGVGFVLAVVSLLLLLTALRTWVSPDSGWKSWLERLWP